MRGTQTDLVEKISALEQELAEQIPLADAGTLAGPLMHEINNFLNATTLQLTVLESQVPASMRPDFAGLRRQANETARLVAQLQQYRHQSETTPSLVNLNDIVNAALHHVAQTADATPQLELGTDLPAVYGSIADLKRLCTFLIRNAVFAAATNQAEVTVRTKGHQHHACLEVEDSGPSIAPGSLDEIFSPSATVREGTSSLELAACKKLATRLKANLQAKNRPGGGVIVSVELASAGL